MTHPVEIAQRAIKEVLDAHGECSAEILARAVIAALEANGARIMWRNWEKWMEDAVLKPNAQGYVYQAIFDASHLDDGECPRRVNPRERQGGELFSPSAASRTSLSPSPQRVRSVSLNGPGFASSGLRGWARWRRTSRAAPPRTHLSGVNLGSER
jgi:hypothetical protein